MVEEPFGRARQEMREAIDLVAIIDLPLEVALARRIRRNIQPAIEDSAARFSDVRRHSRWNETNRGAGGAGGSGDSRPFVSVQATVNVLGLTGG